MTEGGSRALASPSLAGLADVQLTNLNNNDILVYDSTLGAWKNSPTIPVTAGVDSVNGLAGILTLNSANAGIGVSSAVSTIQLTLGELSYGTLGGISIVITSPATNDTLTYNGTDWVNAPGGAAIAWSSLTNPTGALSLTMAAADTTTFTCSATSQTAFTWTSSTLTTGSLAAFSLTGSSAFNGQSLVSITSTSTGIVGISSALLQVELTGALSGTQPVTAGEFVAFNSGAGVTNIALYLIALNGGAGNIALKLGGGSILSTVPQTWALESNTASALNITDGTNAYYTIDTRTTQAGIIFHYFSSTNPTIGSGLSAPNLFRLKASTITYTGSSATTNANGVMGYIERPVLTDASAMTITTASTFFIYGPPFAAGSVTITNPFAFYVFTGNSYFGGNLVATLDGGNGLALQDVNNAYANAFVVLGSSGSQAPSSGYYIACAGFNVGTSLTTNATITTASAGSASTALYIGNAYILVNGGVLSKYNAISLVNHGLPAEYASTGTTAVALGTVSTAITSYTPTVNGQFLGTRERCVRGFEHHRNHYRHLY